METYVESYKESNETSICKLHTQVCRDLNAWYAGEYLYQGARRKKLKELLQMTEDAILSEEPGDHSARLHARYRSIWYRSYFR